MKKEAFTPFNDRLLVRPLPVESKTSLLAQVEAQKDKPTRGIVVAVAFSYEGLEAVMPGSKIQWQPYAGRPCIINGEEFLILRMEELDGRIDEVEE